MSLYVPAELRDAVQLRADFRCEYCLLPEGEAIQPHQVEHIVSRKYQGATILENLAWACMVCNLAKGPEIAGIDPLANAASRLFNPRSDRWTDHFRFDAGQIVGITLEGRVTERVLQFNREHLIEQRRILHAAGRYG